MLEAIRNSLARKFLSIILPILLLVSLAFIVYSFHNKFQLAADTHHREFSFLIEKLASQLQEPVWTISDNLIRSLIDSNLAVEDLLCIYLVSTENIHPPFSGGDCLQNASPDNITIMKPVTYSNRDVHHHIADLSITFQPLSFAKSLDGLLRSSLDIAITVISIMIIGTFTTLFAFRITILTPLSHFAQSIRNFEKTGKHTAIQWQSDDELGQVITAYNNSIVRQLESEQRENTAQQKAEEALLNLKKTQQELIHSEKLAAIGSMVAGVAHEVNTPIGNSVIVSTTLADHVTKIRENLESGQIKKSDLIKFINEVDEASLLLSNNLLKTAELISHFKQVTADQTSSRRRRFSLDSVVTDILFTMAPKLKHLPHQVINAVQEGIEMDSYPGPLGQIITNAINNSLLHGFEADVEGVITIRTDTLDDQHVDIIIQDNGQGMSPEYLSQAMQPFFTTKMSTGGTGLGLSLVKSITEEQLGGHVTLESAINEGFAIRLSLPLQAPLAEHANAVESH